MAGNGSEESPNINLELSLGGSWTEVQVSREGNSSTQGENNDVMHSRADRSGAEIGSGIIPRSTSPTVDELVRAVVSVEQNPAFQRAMKFIRDGVANRPSHIRSHTIQERNNRVLKGGAANKRSRKRSCTIQGTCASLGINGHNVESSLPSPSNVVSNKEPSLHMPDSLSMTSNVGKICVNIISKKEEQDCNFDSANSFFSTRNHVPKPSRVARGLLPRVPQMLVAASSSRAEKNLSVSARDESQLAAASKKVRTDDENLEEKLPRVWTNGGNPDGVIIEGFVRKYTDGNVLILCACHEQVFTPKGFVMHAGGGDVGNPCDLINMADGF